MATVELPSWLADEQRYEPTGARHRVMQQKVFLHLASLLERVRLGGRRAHEGGSMVDRALSCVSAPVRLVGMFVPDSILGGPVFKEQVIAPGDIFIFSKGNRLVPSTISGRDEPARSANVGARSMFAAGLNSVRAGNMPGAHNEWHAYTAFVCAILRQAKAMISDCQSVIL